MTLAAPMTDDERLQWVTRLKGYPITLLLFLFVLRRPVHERVITGRLTMDKATARKHLGTLEREGLAVNVDEFWQLPAHGRQLALDLMVASPNGDAGEIAPAADQLAGPDAGLVIVRKPRENFSLSSIGITESIDSPQETLKTNTTRARKFLAGRAGAHIGQVLAGLARKGLPAQAADDPLPADLRVCVEVLVRELSCPRRKAELAVAESPWGAGEILAEIRAWQARRRSPEGRTIRPAGFPFLVLHRIAAGDPCPPTAVDDDPYAGYAAYAVNLPQPDESE